MAAYNCPLYRNGQLFGHFFRCAANRNRQTTDSHPFFGVVIQQRGRARREQVKFPVNGVARVVHAAHAVASRVSRDAGDDDVRRTVEQNDGANREEFGDPVRLPDVSRQPVEDNQVRGLCALYTQTGGGNLSRDGKVRILQQGPALQRDLDDAQFGSRQPAEFAAACRGTPQPGAEVEVYAPPAGQSVLSQVVAQRALARPRRSEQEQGVMARGVRTREARVVGNGGGRSHSGHPYFPLARAVELAEKDALPRPELEATAGHNDPDR